MQLTKNVFRLLLLSILAAGFALSAHATTTPLAVCGAVGSAPGSDQFSAASNGAAGEATVSAGTGIITCNGITVPTGQTLIGETFEVLDDAMQSNGPTSQMIWTWTYSGEALNLTPSATNTENGNSSFGFDDCTGTGTLACGTLDNFTTLASYTGGMTTGNFVFDVMSTPTVNPVGPTGAVSAELLVEFTYAPTQSSNVPEPASLALLGSGLIGLGMLARRKGSSSPC